MCRVCVYKNKKYNEVNKNKPKKTKMVYSKAKIENCKPLTTKKLIKKAYNRKKRNLH